MQIDCIKFIEDVRSQQDLTEKAKLVIVQVGDDSRSNAYIRSKVKESEKWNIDVQVIKTDENIRTDELCGYIYDLNHSRDVDGIILQLPLPKHIDEEKVINFIDEKKNVDGFKQFGIKSKYFEPCTPKGIIMLLDRLTDLDGKFVTLIGRGKTVGEPLRDMLLAKNCTLSIAHSHTIKEELELLLSYSDVIISAVGKTDLFSFSVIKNNAIVVDAGISIVNGKQVGDFSHKYIDMWEESVSYTPWTKGVGKLTVMALMLNVRKAHELMKKNKKELKDYELHKTKSNYYNV